MFSMNQYAQTGKRGHPLSSYEGMAADPSLPFSEQPVWEHPSSESAMPRHGQVVN